MRRCTNPESNPARQRWNKEREGSERTDPDYLDRAEERILQDILKLTESEQFLALEGYLRKNGEELVAHLGQMKEKK